MAEQTSLLPLRGIRPDVARRHITAFRKHFGEAHLYFAQHAAFPLAVTPELLYHLWANFQRDARGERLNIPWIAVADLLLSGLCDEVSHELFEMDITIREILLSDLKAHAKFGQKRLLELSHFLFRYIQPHVESPDPHVRDVARVNRWVALAYTHPGSTNVARELTIELCASVEQNDTSEGIRLASLTQIFAEPLKDFGPLLTYARGIGYFAQGDIAQALTHFKMIDREEHVVGVKLIIPMDVNGKKENFPQDQVTKKTDIPESEVLPSPSYPSIWHVPYQRNPFFTGREDVLNQLHRALHTDTAIALSQPIGISGLGGIGKTQTALEYAYLYRNEYSAVFWIRADSIASLTSSFIELAHVLNLPESNEQDQNNIIEAVQRWLRLHSEWLLIFDNIDDPSAPVLEPFLPKAGRGHILFTTRSYAFSSIAQRLDIQIMEPDIGALLLLRRADILSPQATLYLISEDDRRLANQISQELDGLPLALDQAGAYIKGASCTLADYLLLYQKRRYDLLQIRGTFSNDYPASVATTWSLSFEKMAQANPASTELLNFCAFLSPDAIPEEIFTIGSSYLGDLLSSIASNPPELDLAITNALRFSLIKRHDDGTLSIHRLVQSILQDTLPPETCVVLKRRAVNVVNAAFPEAIFENWARCERLSSHALVCADWIEQEHILKPEVIHLLNEAGSYLYARARYEEATLLLEQALQISQEQLGIDHPGTAMGLNNLANLYRVQGKYTQAEPLYKQALQICEGQLGMEDPYIATSLNGLALLYERQEKYREAESLLKRSLEIRERLLGTEHPDTAQSLNSLALLYERQEKYREAESLLKRALEIRERLLGTEHPDTTQSLNDLAQLYAIQGNHVEAESLLKQALQIRERQPGTEHPDIAQSLTQEKHEETKPHHTISTHEQQLEANHPESEDTLKDFFISYAPQDLQWAKWINEQLEMAGYKTIFPDRDFLPEKNVILEMDNATHAKCIIAVLSPNYLTSQFTQPEWETVLHQDPTGAQGLLLPIRVLPCDVGGLLAPLIYVDLVGQEDLAKARKILLAGVDQTPKKLMSTALPSQIIPNQSSTASTSQQLRFGTPFPEYWNVPRRHAPYFTGRDAQIEQIFQLFTYRDDEYATQIPDPQAIVGLGGLGKTQTAAEYAYRYRDKYRAVLWTRANTKENLMADFRSLVRLLLLPTQEDPIEIMHMWFKTQSDWLLIFDSADDLQVIDAFLPPIHRGHVLLTTRVRAASIVAHPILLEPLNSEDGALCILRRAGSIPRTGHLDDVSPLSRRDAAIRISELMDGLPLALEQAGAYIEDTGSSESRYLKIYEQRRDEIIRRQYGALPNYFLSVAAAWGISRSIVKQREPATFALLQLCAFLAPDAIPEEIFTKGASVLGTELESVAVDPIAIDHATVTLRKYSLLNREVNKDDAIARFSIHRMIQEILKDEMDEATQQLWAERAVRAVSLSLPSVEEHIIQAHVRHCIPLIEQWNMTFPEAEHLRQYVEEPHR
jgi:tetratricopeptide (TPR) repeat protein